MFLLIYRLNKHYFAKQFKNKIQYKYSKTIKMPQEQQNLKLTK